MENAHFRHENGQKNQIRSVVVLSGGVGGARLAYGLAAQLPPESLTIVVNTGDDFIHWGLRVSPDVDTMMYTLAGLSDEAQGWGLEGETFSALAMVGRYGGDTWFRLGDRDLATHLMRSEALAKGDSLTRVTARLCDALGVKARVLPMSDDVLSTMIDTKGRGTLSFQDWFVRYRADLPVERVWFKGDARPTMQVIHALKNADLVIIAPSNPYVSIDPILSLSGVQSVMREIDAPVVAVSPIVDGRAIKGPLAAMIRDIAKTEASAQAIALHYGPLIRAIVIERGDEVRAADQNELAVLATSTVMKSLDDRIALAGRVLAFAESLK